jgi:hypothetical protein
MSNYIPMTADEATKLNLRPDGVYAFEVLNATAAVSKAKGSPMIALELGFYDEDGSRFSIKDWLVHSDNRWSEKKVFDFAGSTGLAAKYAAGEMVAEDCLGRSGFAAVGIEAGKPKDGGGGNFPDRNKVKYYTVKPTAKPDGAPSPQTASKSQVESDLDSAPF